MKRPRSLQFYRWATAIVSPAIILSLHARARRGKEDPHRFQERLGRPSTARPGGVLVWLHAVSVGESLSLLPLIERFAIERPDLTILVTTGTRSATEMLAPRLPNGVIHQYAPMDTPAATTRFLRFWAPALAVFAESELWPNLILTARQQGVRLALVSAGMSAKSFAGWRWFPAAARTVLSAFDLVLARNDDAADRLTALGACVTGRADLKFGANSLPSDAATLAQMRAGCGDRRIVLAASTHAGEDEIVLDAFGACAAQVLVIAPRHPERGARIAALATARGLRTGRRSLGDDPTACDVYIADRLGEMGLWYRLADRAVICGSLVPGVGGHNPLEAARLNCPFVAGKHVAAWPIYLDMVAVGATRLVTSADLTAALCSDERQSADLAHDFVATLDLEARNALSRITALAPS